MRFARGQKKEAVLELCTGTGAAKEVAKKYGVTRETLYNWRKDLLPGGGDVAMAYKVNKPLPDGRDVLLAKIEELKRQIKKLELEKDVLEGTVEILKKDPGGDPKNLTNKEKTDLVDALKNKYPERELLACLGLARSSYFYHRKMKQSPDKYEQQRPSGKAEQEEEEIPKSKDSFKESEGDKHRRKAGRYRNKRKIWALGDGLYSWQRRRKGSSIVGTDGAEYQAGDNTKNAR